MQRAAAHSYETDIVESVMLTEGIFVQLMVRLVRWLQLKDYVITYRRICISSSK